jgi:hypothetical protein
VKRGAALAIMAVTLGLVTVGGTAAAAHSTPRPLHACRLLAVAYERDTPSSGADSVAAALRIFHKVNDPVIVEALDRNPGDLGAALGSWCKERYAKDPKVRRAQFPAMLAASTRR